MTPSFRQIYSVKTPFSQSNEFYRILIAIGGLTYLLWWKTVDIYLAGSFNPFASRLAVVLFCWAIFGLSFVIPGVLKRAPVWLSVCVWVITAHYFYLLVHNLPNNDWISGTYITLIAACATLQSEKELLAYSAWVLVLSVGAALWEPSLLGTIFLPGISTVLIIAYVGIRARVRWLKRSIETSRWFQDLFDSVFEGIVIHDRGLILHANGAFATLLGYQPEEVLGKHVADFVIPERRDHLLRQVEAESELPYQITGRKKDGTTLPLEIRGKKHLVNGRPLRLAALSDITDRIKGEQARVIFEAQQEAIRVRDEFLAIASHELKTPLTKIKLQTQLTALRVERGDQTVFQPDEVRQFALQTDRHANQIVQLVEQMLEVSRISTGKLDLDLTELDLAKLVTDTVDRFEKMLNTSGSKINVELAEVSLVRADRARLEQSITSLLSNAIRFGAGKHISVRVETAAGKARLSITDRGIGIAPENQRRIFNRFERAAADNHISGLGLGLYITKNIIEAHHGSVTLNSETGEGSCFIITLPTLGERTGA